MTQLLDGHTYMLPDDTEVLAVDVEPGRFRLDDASGQPLYLQDAGRWHRLTYNAAEDCYTVGACDVSSANLWPVERVHQ